MKSNLVLYVTREDATGQKVSESLNAIGCDLVLAYESSAIAVLFLKKDIEMAILDARGVASPNLHLARAMKSLRPDLKILLLASEPLAEDHDCIDQIVCSSGPALSAAALLKELLSSECLSAPFLAGLERPDPTATGRSA